MYVMDYTLSAVGKKYLLSRKDVWISDLYYTFDSGWDCAFFFSDRKDNGLIIRNKCFDEKQDRDEYNAFRISIGKRSVLEEQRMHFRVNPDKTLTFVERKTLPWQCVPIHEKIRSADLFRDHVHWKYKNHTWDVTADVAIRITTSSHKIMTVLCDCVGETLETYVNYKERENAILSKRWSKKLWGMKCENADRWERQIIHLF